MTQRDPDDLRDARVDAAWRAASREEPPPALDAAIRAAARREIGAGPQRTSGSNSLRPQRWWWPLAAAATVGAIAIGLLQLADREHVNAGVAGDEKAVVSDVPAAAATANGQESTPPMPAQEQTPVSPPTPVAPAPASASPRAKSAARLEDSRTREATATANALRKDAAPMAFPRDERNAAGAIAAPAVSEPRAATNAAAPAPAVAQPFPADAAKNEARASRPDDMPAASAVSPSAPSAVPAAARRDAQRASGSAYKQSAESAGVAQGPSTNRANTAPPMSVPDWIAQIRRLREEGRTDDAARELAAFRRAHPDHEQLLPADLRSWKPASPP